MTSRQLVSTSGRGYKQLFGWYELLLQLVSAYSYSTSVRKVVFGACYLCLGEGMQAPTKYGQPAGFVCGHGSERLFFDSIGTLPDGKAPCNS